LEETPLHAAVDCPSVNAPIAVKLLLMNGAKLIKNRYGKSPLDLVTEKTGSKEIYDLLSKQG
jgi:hypothetical protein